jgi:drug/metabolite transporter (DMT)-like permease
MIGPNGVLTFFTVWINLADEASRITPIMTAFKASDSLGWRSWLGVLLGLLGLVLLLRGRLSLLEPVTITAE